MLDVLPADAAAVKAILARLVPDREVWAYGSRVTGKARPASDLDIVVRGSFRLDLGTLSRLREAFENAPIGPRVDITDWNAISPDFQALIQEAHEPLQTPLLPPQART